MAFPACKALGNIQINARLYVIMGIITMHLNRLKAYLSMTFRILQSLEHSTATSDYQERTVCLVHYMELPGKIIFTMNKCFMMHYKSITMPGLKKATGFGISELYSGIWLGCAFDKIVRFLFLH